MKKQKKQIALIVILILAILGAGCFVLHETLSDKTGSDAAKPSTASDSKTELNILLPKTKYDDVEVFIKKYNKEDNKYHINYQLIGDDYETDPDVMNPDEADPADYDGLIVPGGKHVHPSFYGAEVECDKHGFDKPLDELELKVVKRFVKAEKPILGVCRGNQLVNVALGGTLKQDIGMGHYDDAVRETIILEDSVFYDKLGGSVDTVHYHHQAIDELADGLTVTMYDAEDNTIEGFVHDELPILGYQFHPDRMYVKDDPELVKMGLFFMEYFFDVCYENK